MKIREQKGATTVFCLRCAFCALFGVKSAREKQRPINKQQKIKGKNNRTFRSPYGLRFTISHCQGLDVVVFTFSVALADYAL